MFFFQPFAGYILIFKVTAHDIVSELNQKDDQFEWNGEKFIVKPMELSRVILSDLSVETEIVSKNVQLEPYQQVDQIKASYN